MRESILALRDQHSPQFNNIACLRTNAQKYLINYFRKGQLTKLFFLFPVRETFSQDGKQPIAQSYRAHTQGTGSLTTEAGTAMTYLVCSPMHNVPLLCMALILLPPGGCLVVPEGMMGAFRGATRSACLSFKTWRVAGSALQGWDAPPPHHQPSTAGRLRIPPCARRHALHHHRCA